MPSSMVAVLDTGAARTAVPASAIGVDLNAEGQPTFRPGSLAQSCDFRKVSLLGVAGRRAGISLRARIRLGDVDLLEDFDLLVMGQETIDYPIVGRDVINRYTALFCPGRNKAKLSNGFWAGLLGKFF